MILPHLPGEESLQGEGEAQHHPALEPGDEDGRLGLLDSEDQVGGHHGRPEDEQDHDQARGLQLWSSARHLQIPAGVTAMRSLSGHDQITLRELVS